MKNQSLFCQSIQHKNSINFLDLWQATLSAGDDYKTQRALDDEVERQFWVNHSKVYDQKLSLYDYAPEVYDHLLTLIGKNKTLIEFGCGTGKFTLPMAGDSRSIIGVDFSNAMLDILQSKLQMQAIDNVKLIVGKFETTDLPNVQCVYGINANYRMYSIDQVINKMMSLASERVIFVWTMQRSIYDAILNKTSIKGIGRKQEYIYLINLLYTMGYDPNLDIKKVIKPIIIEDISDHYKELKKLAETYDLSYTSLKQSFDEKIEHKPNSLVYNCQQTVAFIYLDKNKE